MSAFFEKFKSEISSRVALVFWALLTLFLAMTGPYGSYIAVSAGMRLLVCAPIMAALLVVGTAIRTFVFFHLFPGEFRKSVLVNAALAVIVLTPMINVIIDSFGLIPSPSHPSLGEIALLVGSLSLALSSVRRSVDPEFMGVAETAPIPEPPPPHARLMQRLEPDLRGALYAISVRDHYVDVQTSAGQASLLMRLGDAMAESEPIDGSQVHRSHWVAWDAIAAVEKEPGKTYLRLKNGNRVPVSKNHRDKLDLRGLL